MYCQQFYQKPISTQPIVLDSPNGTYVVLQRMQKNGNTETLNKIKGMGIKGFREVMKKFMTQHKTWTPPLNNKAIDPEWYKNDVNSALKNPRAVAQFIHEFFKN